MLPVLARRRQNEICRIHLRRACCGQKKYHPPGSEPRACPLEVESGARLGSLAPDSRSLALGSTSLALYRLEKPGSKLDKQSSVWSKPGAYTLRACARCRRPLPRPPLHMASDTHCGPDARHTWQKGGHVKGPEPEPRACFPGSRLRAWRMGPHLLWASALMLPSCHVTTLTGLGS